eukprot:NODE_5112_length_697_cov_24.047368_g4949_i0.p1 GENE.NODE_5112_length_697_cov_24.047368_g4949_i0~~NODE_5112_length_697_cov_24.047368_g4949_i0.p1  ORF type:complete len:206 (+),score=63.13 NODE_5112_length_697_cov_24.047368_g4949_i0:27-620(+)
MQTFTTQLGPLVEGRQWDEILKLCENVELESTQELPAEFWLVFLFCSLITDEMENLRFVYHRIPAADKQTDHIQALWRVAKCLYERRWGEAQAALAAHQWPGPAFQQALQGACRERVLSLFSRAYTTTSTEALALALGCDQEAAVQFAHSRKLVDTVEQGFVHSKSVINPEPKHKSTEITGLTTLKTLASHTLFIEK